jgi:Tetratricopeptide repeat
MIQTIQAKALQHVQDQQYELALQCFEQVLQYHLEHSGRAHPATASAHHNLGTVHAKRATVAADTLRQRHCRQSALECFQAAARSARDSSLGPDHPNVAVSLVRVGFLLLQSKQYRNSLVTFQEALRIRLAAFGRDHGLTANLYNNLGVCSMHMGEFERGRECLQQALEIQRNLLSSSSPPPPSTPNTERDSIELELADTLFNIGGLCLEWIRRQGPDARRASEAESAFYEALEIRTRLLGQDDPMVLQVHHLLNMAKAVPRPRAVVSRSMSSASPRSPTPGHPPHGQQQQQLMSSPHRSKTASALVSPESNSGLIDPPPVRRSAPNRFSPSNHQQQSPLPLMHSSSPMRPSPMDDPSAIFRKDTSSSSRREATARQSRSPSSQAASSTKPRDRHQAPMLSITVSKEEEENEDEENIPSDQRGNTRIYIAPHIVQGSFPPRRSTNADESGDAVAGASYERDSFAVDTSEDRTAKGAAAKVENSYTYDAEENCLINDGGVDTGYGRIHYPLAWSRAGIQTHADHHNSPQRDIMVTRPVRGTASLQQEESRTGSGLRAVSDGLPSRSSSSGNWGSETVNFSTGNKERDDIMAKARAILEAHGGSVDEQDDEILVKEASSDTKRVEQDPLEEGVTPLGGKWGAVPSSKNLKKSSHLSVREMLKDPMTYMNEIHEEASKQLQDGNVADAQRLFEVILQCQRHVHGPLHEDVAAALHNIGITQLRAQNHTEALKAFEEAARVRKGSLGKDHPLVAVSHAVSFWEVL